MFSKSATWTFTGKTMCHSVEEGNDAMQLTRVTCRLPEFCYEFSTMLGTFCSNLQTSKLCRRDAARSSRHALFPTLRDRQNGLCRERQLMATPTALHQH